MSNSDLTKPSILKDSNDYKANICNNMRTLLRKFHNLLANHNANCTAFLTPNKAKASTKERIILHSKQSCSAEFMILIIIAVVTIMIVYKTTAKR